MEFYSPLSTGLLLKAYAHEISIAPTADADEAVAIQAELKRRGVDPTHIAPAPLDENELASLRQGFREVYYGAASCMTDERLRQTYVELSSSPYKDFADIIQAEITRRETPPTTVLSQGLSTTPYPESARDYVPRPYAGDDEHDPIVHSRLQPQSRGYHERYHYPGG